VVFVPACAGMRAGVLRPPAQKICSSYLQQILCAGVCQGLGENSLEKRLDRNSSKMSNGILTYCSDLRSIEIRAKTPAHLAQPRTGAAYPACAPHLRCPQSAPTRPRRWCPAYRHAGGSGKLLVCFRAVPGPDIPAGSCTGLQPRRKPAVSPSVQPKRSPSHGYRRPYPRVLPPSIGTRGMSDRELSLAVKFLQG
jgi:hypothetical protein